jgi:hypothetical protein
MPSRAASLGMLALACWLAIPVHANQAQIANAVASQSSDGSYRFDVTVRHDDEGWQHYADSWQVLTVDGRVLGERILLHPHVDEQPFTRSLSGLSIPPEIHLVRIRVHDTLHGYSSETVEVSLP